MTASIPGAEDESRQDTGTQEPAHAQVSPGSSDAQGEAPSSTVSLMSGAAADRCAVCSTLMTSEQRYCVECGTRRGKPRFEPAKRHDERASAAPAPRPSVVARLGGNAAAALVLLLVLVALGIGVLIGASGTQTVHVTVAGGVGSTGSSASSSATTKAKSPPKPAKANSNPFPSS